MTMLPPAVEKDGSSILPKELELEHEDAHMIPEAVHAAAEEKVREQVPVDLVELESMESFPCSDPPGSGAHA
jgi:hypothetical protein